MNEFSRNGGEEPYFSDFPEIILDKESSDQPTQPRIEVNEPATPNDGFIKSPATELNPTAHSEVARYRQEREACSIKLPDYKVDDGGGFTITNRLVHYDLDGNVVEGDSPYEGVGDFARDGIRQLNEQKGQMIRTLLDAPDINGEYREIIEEASQSQGNDSSNVKILSANAYDELCAQPGLEVNRDAPAFKKFGLTIIKETDPENKEFYGDRLLRFILHHEGSHPDDKGEDITWYSVPSITPEGGTVAHGTSGDPIGNFNFTGVSSLKPLEFQDRGCAFEEGYAELKALMAVNDFTEIDESAPPLVGVRPDGKIAQIKNNDTSDYSYLIPKEFAQATSDDGKTFAVGGPYTPAAYALYQLDKRCDGEILSNLELAREDPKAFDNVITALEGVRPGLFRELYNLQRDEFHKSLWLADPERPE
jgi:hypothetical protein